VGGDLEVGGTCHETIVARERWQDKRMTAKRPGPTVLTGNYVRLEPLTSEALPELHAAIGSPAVFAGGYGGGPQGYRSDPDEFVEWAKGYYSWESGNPMLVRVIGGPLDGVAVGTSTLGDFDAKREHAHIGWTAYDPRVWGTQVNAEAKLLMLGHAFDSGFGRVKIQTDILNERSQAAVLRLGAVSEGVVRRDILRADGSWRDTAVFSILIDEWPDVRAGLTARLAKWGDEPVRYRD
jgi:RimJ/RimL family protein N-acetyltransferase